MRVVASFEGGMTHAEVAELFDVSVATVGRFVKQWRETGSFTARHIPGRPPTLQPGQITLLWRQLAEHPRATLREHARRWEEQTGTWVSLATMSRMIRRIGWTQRNRRWVPPNGMQPATLVSWSPHTLPRTGS